MLLLPIKIPVLPSLNQAARIIVVRDINLDNKVKLSGVKDIVREAKLSYAVPTLIYSSKVLTMTRRNGNQIQTTWMLFLRFDAGWIKTGELKILKLNDKIQ
jgi:hypothetical protein